MNRVNLDLGGNSNNPSFIGSWMLPKKEICDDLVNLFENGNLVSSPGRTSGGVNLSVKDSTDIAVFPKDIEKQGNESLSTLVRGLFDCYKDYVEQWPALKGFCDNLELGKFNLQRYAAGQHFSKSHCERSDISSLHRVLAWMTYLNDVDESQGGATYFDYFDIRVQPRKGLTLIWPCEWTHFHKGEVIESGSKYIATGWMNFAK